MGALQAPVVIAYHPIRFSHPPTEASRTSLDGSGQGVTKERKGSYATLSPVTASTRTFRTGRTADKQRNDEVTLSLTEQRIRRGCGGCPGCPGGPAQEREGSPIDDSG